MDVEYNPLLLFVPVNALFDDQWFSSGCPRATGRPPSAYYLWPASKSMDRRVNAADFPDENINIYDMRLWGIREALERSAPYPVI